MTSSLLSVALVMKRKEEVALRSPRRKSARVREKGRVCLPGKEVRIRTNIYI